MTLWESILAPIAFGVVGAFLLVFAVQTILPMIASNPSSVSADYSPTMLNVDVIAGFVGFCDGFAIWYWRQSRTSK